MVGCFSSEVASVGELMKIKETDEGRETRRASRRGGYGRAFSNISF